jgi:hypothetical protein
VKEDSPDLFQGTLQEFSWRNRGKPRINCHIVGFQGYFPNITLTFGILYEIFTLSTENVHL